MRGLTPDPEPPAAMTHTWRTKRKHPERFGQPCVIEGRHKRQLVVRFSDGVQTLAHSNHVRKIQK